jgi:hypothetical protein
MVAYVFVAGKQCRNNSMLNEYSTSISRCPPSPPSASDSVDNPNIPTYHTSNHQDPPPLVPITIQLSESDFLYIVTMLQNQQRDLEILKKWVAVMEPVHESCGILSNWW